MSAVLVWSAAFPYAVLSLPVVMLVSVPVPPPVFPTLSLASQSVLAEQILRRAIALQ
jgi:hypothetical protein